MQPGLFDEPEREQARQPAAAKKAGSTPVKYADSGTRDKCADCQQLVYEDIMARGNSTWSIRRARVKRTQGDVELLLCTEHANLRKEQEAERERKSP